MAKKNLLQEFDFDPEAIKNKIKKANLSEDNDLFENNTKNTYIEFELIEENPDNKFSIKDSDVYLTAMTIHAFGLVQPLSVRKRENKYRIIEGNKRRRAIELLRQWHSEDPIKFPNEWKYVECSIKTKPSDDAKLDDETYDNILRIQMYIANMDRRHFTPAEIRTHINDLVEELEIYKKRSGISEKDINEIISGVVDVKRRQIYKYKKINKYLILPIKWLFDEGKITINIAEKISTKSVQIQLLAMSIISGQIELTNITTSELDSLIDKITEDKQLTAKLLQEQLLEFENIESTSVDEFNRLCENKLESGNIEIDEKLQHERILDLEEKINECRAYIKILKSEIIKNSKCSDESKIDSIAEIKKLRRKEAFKKSFISFSTKMDSYISVEEEMTKADIDETIEVIADITLKLEEKKKELLEKQNQLL